MNYLPEELVLNILTFLPNNNLTPVNKSLFSLYIVPWLVASSPNCGDKKLVRFLF